jgi:hypothetical protein
MTRKEHLGILKVKVDGKTTKDLPQVATGVLNAVSNPRSVRLVPVNNEVTC